MDYKKYYLEEIWLNLNQFLTPVGLVLALAGLISPPARGYLFHWWLLFWLVDFSVEAKHLATDPYNLSIVHPIAAGLAGIALGRQFVWAEIRVGAKASVLIVVVLLGSILLYGRSTVTRLMNESSTGPDLYKLGVVLRKQAEPGDLVVSMGGSPLAIYYSGLRGWRWSGEYQLDRLQDLERRGATWLLVPSYLERSVKGLTEKTSIISNYVSKNYQLVYQSSGGRIYRLHTDRSDR